MVAHVVSGETLLSVFVDVVVPKFHEFFPEGGVDQTNLEAKLTSFSDIVSPLAKAEVIHDLHEEASHLPKAYADLLLITVAAR